MTTTTVGYGDLVPETATGRVIGLVPMLAGIGIIGIITANIASMFLEPDPARAADEGGSERHSTQARFDEIDRKLDEIMQGLDDR